MLSSVKTDKADHPESSASENTNLIIAGMALVNKNENLYFESVMHLSQPHKEVLNSKVHDLLKLSTEQIGLLQLIMHVAVARWDKLLCLKILQFGQDFKTKLVLNHETIALALSHVINYEKDSKPDFEILRLLLEFEVVVAMDLDLNTITDEATKRHI